MPFDGTIGEIMPVAFSSVIPQGWMPCEGQILPISNNQALFSLLGNRYGGDGRNNFALPDLRGTVIVGVSTTQTYALGARGGAENVPLIAAQMPAHTHTAFGSTHEPNASSVVNAIFSNTQAVQPVVPTPPNLYGPPANLVAIDPDTVVPQGVGQPHNNIQPTLTIRYLICTQGMYPMRP